jgi:hypothetical protein
MDVHNEPIGVAYVAQRVKRLKHTLVPRARQAPDGHKSGGTRLCLKMEGCLTNQGLAPKVKR